MTSNIEAPHFVEGNVYSRAADIHDRFGGNRQSGIATAPSSHAIFIFTGDEGEQFGYVDSWDQADQVYTYTAEGQLGDMTYARGNLAVRNHLADGRSLHLFKKVTRAGGKYRYVGEMQCAETRTITGSDRNGHDRNIIQFELVRLRSVTDCAEDEQPGADNSGAPLDELRERAYAAIKPTGADKTQAVRSIYQRAKDVTIYALKRADGTCESCGQDAPFLKPNGQPYLEVHHTDRISDGGLDAPNNVAAICPTCHRRVHHGIDGRRVNDELRAKISALKARVRNHVTD